MEMPSRFLETEKIAPDTHVLRQVVGAGPVKADLDALLSAVALEAA